MKVSSILTRGILLAAIMVPVPALASPGYISTTINLRAGPGTLYPVIDRISGRIVEVNGCLRDGSWCEVTVDSRRHRNDRHGWISGRFVQPASWRNNRYIITPQARVSVPIIRFDIERYWDAFYRDYDFYKQRRYYYTRERNQARNDWRDWDDRRDRDRDWRDRDYDRNDRTSSNDRYDKWND